MKLSWSMQRRLERWKIKYAKIINWSMFIKKEIVSDYNKIKKLLERKNKKKVKKMKIDKNKKETMFFDSKEYIGLTVNKGEIKLIEKPPQEIISFKNDEIKTKPTWFEHDRNCDCEECLDSLITDLKFKFDTENDF